ncbi:hypothetical protein FOZ63_032958, partial [Perkinsus olseni]
VAMKAILHNQDDGMQQRRNLLAYRQMSMCPYDPYLNAPGWIKENQSLWKRWLDEKGIQYKPKATALLLLLFVVFSARTGSSKSKPKPNAQNGRAGSDDDAEGEDQEDYDEDYLFEVDYEAEVKRLQEEADIREREEAKKRAQKEAEMESEKKRTARKQRKSLYLEKKDPVRILEMQRKRKKDRDNYKPMKPGQEYSDTDTEEIVEWAFARRDYLINNKGKAGLKEAKELERRALMHLEWKERRVENRGRKKKKKRKTKEGSDKHEREKKDKKKKKGDTAIVISPYFFRSSSLLRRMFPRLSALFSSQGSRRGPPRRDARPTDDGADDSWGLFPRVIGVQRTNDPTRTGTYTKKSPASSASRREERYTSEGRGPDSGQVGASSDETYLFFPQEHTSRSIIRVQ